MGDNKTKTKKVACPHCKNEITIHGTSGETIEITCSKCNTKGIFAFPEEKPVSRSTTGPVAIEVNNLEFTYPKSNKKAVNGVSFGIKKGEIFGFLGPNGDQIYYYFSWGDDTTSGWVGPYESGEIGEASHTWENQGNYEIKVKAKDEHGVQSEWSDPLPIKMPRNKAFNFNYLLEFLFERFPTAFPKLRHLMKYK